MGYSVEDTMFFFFFGFTPDEFSDESNNDALLRKLISKALMDATMQGAYNTKVEKNEDNKTRIQSAKVKTIAYLSDQIQNKLKAIQNIEDYDRWHNRTCNYVCDLFKGIKGKKDGTTFSYGNAQKVVNMSMKYLYLLSKSSVNSELPTSGKILRIVEDNTAFFHMPIDSYIIDAMFVKGILKWEECKETKDLQSLVGPKQKKPDKGKRYSEHIKTAWSNWDGDLYRAVLNRIREGKPREYANLLDWENELWLEQAKNRRLI